LSYPVVVVGPPPAQRRRVTILFRGVLAAPHFVYLGCWAIVIACVAFGAWCSITFTGRLDEGTYNRIARFLRYRTQVVAYAVLITDIAPRWGGSDDHPVHVHFDGPPLEYDRVLALFRLIVGLPVIFGRILASYGVMVSAICAWFTIVFTGRNTNASQVSLVQGVSYDTHAAAYLICLTDTKPLPREDLISAFGAPRRRSRPQPDIVGLPEWLYGTDARPGP
jgi:hypothetical protein